MNKFLRELMTKHSSFNGDMPNQRVFKDCFRLFEAFISNDFFDIERALDTHLIQDGVYFTIPYYDEDLSLLKGPAVPLVNVYRSSNNHPTGLISIMCTYEITAENTKFLYEIYGSTSIGQPKKLLLLAYDAGQYFTEVEDYTGITLTGLLNKYGYIIPIVKQN